METDRLRAFRAIVDAGSLSGAAEILNISHSGLSKAMSSLREELGFEIFRPNGRGLEITERGRELYNRSQKVLELVDSLRTASNVSERDVPKVGVPEVLGYALSGRVISELQGGISLEEFDSGAIEARVLDGRLDFGFSFVPFPHPELSHLKFSKCRLASFARKGAFKGIPFERVPFVIPSQEMEDNPLSLKIRDGWKASLERNTAYRTNDLGFAIEMARSGGCAIYLPAFLARHLNRGMHEKWLFESLEAPDDQITIRDIFLVKKRTVDESREMKALVRIVRQILNERET